MKVARHVCCLILVGLCQAPLLPAQSHTDRGAVLGGLSGALLGAAVGNQNGDTAEGALLGGALGVLSGAVIGNSMDAADARWHAYHQQQYRQQAAAIAQAVRPADVITLTHSGVGDAVIVNQIRQRGVQRRLEISDVIALHEQGVSERVITEMQQASLATRVPSVPVASPPVVVERHHYVAPRYWYPAPAYHRHYYYHPPPTPRPGVQFGIRVGH